MKKLCLVGTVFCTFVNASTGFAVPSSAFYIAANAGIMQVNFNQKYLDQVDLIKQNIADTVTQNDYNAGLAIGYSKLFYNQYLLGAELSGNLDSHNALYQNGAAGISMTDTTQINNHIDLTFVPGIMLSKAVAAYLKLGVSFASIQDNLTSPTGFTPTIMSFNSNANATGFVGGLGIKVFMTEHVALFAEGNYRDYGSVNFANFSNFTATYTHSAHVYAYGLALGAAYNF